MGYSLSGGRCPGVDPPRPVISWSNLPQPQLLGSYSGAVWIISFQQRTPSHLSSISLFQQPATLLSKSERQCHVLLWLAEGLEHYRFGFMSFRPIWKGPWLAVLALCGKVLYQRSCPLQEQSRGCSMPCNRAIHEGLCPMGGTPRRSRRTEWGGRSSREERLWSDCNLPPHSPSPCTAKGGEKVQKSWVKFSLRRA